MTCFIRPVSTETRHPSGAAASQFYGWNSKNPGKEIPHHITL